MVWLLMFTFHTTPPIFLIWNNICDLVYQPATRTYQSLTVVVTSVFTY